MPVTIREQTSEKYVRLSAADTLIKARASMKGMLGVVFDDEERPVTLVSPADLENIEDSKRISLAKLLPKLPLGILITADGTLGDFVKSKGITALDAGARGAMVYDKNGLVGILTSEVIGHYIAKELEPGGRIKGLESLPSLAGSIMVPKIVLYCTDYNHRNELEYFDPDNPPECQVKKPKPHPVRR